MDKVGILVGHYGQGTGANFDLRDEWTLAFEQAVALVQILNQEKKIRPVLMQINRLKHPWDLFQKTFLSSHNIDIRYQWALRERVDAVVELHLNSANKYVEGHEVFVRRKPGPKTRRLGQCLINEFDAVLENRKRGLKYKNFRVLRKLHAVNIPAAILEPAFLCESVVESDLWKAEYVNAVKTALYHFFNVWGEEE